MADIVLRHYTNPVEITSILLDVYAEVYAAHLEEPFRTRKIFAERLSGHVRGQGWEAVVGFDGEDPVGYMYAATLRAGTTWWDDLDPPVESVLAYEDGRRTLGIFELMVRSRWRKMGLALALHEELVLHRGESRSSLAVDHGHPRVRAMYESWGYSFVGAHRPPGPEAPLLDIMLRDTP